MRERNPFFFNLLAAVKDNQVESKKGERERTPWRLQRHQSGPLPLSNQQWPLSQESLKPPADTRSSSCPSSRRADGVQKKKKKAKNPTSFSV